MLDIFYYVKTNELDDILNYGIKLSESYTRKLHLNGTEKLFLTGLLNPKDEIEKFNSDDYTCLKLNLNIATLKVADSALYGSKYYENTIIPYAEYELGKYMQPEVLISMSILPEIIEEINYYIDSPLLYDNSKELYVNNLIEKISNQLDNSQDVMLNALLKEYSIKNNLNKDTANNINVYYSDNEFYISK
ncbi:MAG: hypothetical protein E7311_05165 [Clostridiales bacterium]|nr:hypothetical protein [Clostridiales bacterium]